MGYFFLESPYTLVTVLTLPEAIYRLENGAGKPDAKGRVRLGLREIALALSYRQTDRCLPRNENGMK